MTFTLLFFFLAQTGFESLGNIKLDASNFALEKLTATPSGLFVCDMNGSTIYHFDDAGKLLRKLENPANKFPFPYQASWNPMEQQVIVFDGGSRDFTIWDSSGNLVKNHATNLDPAYEVGRLVAFSDGYVGAVSLTEKKFLLAKFDKAFKPLKHALELPIPIMAGVGVDQRRGFTARVELAGKLQLIAGQSLSNKLKVFDGNLNEVKEIALSLPGWKAPQLKNLLAVAKNPKESEKLKPSYSEIIAIEPLAGSHVIIGFRNVGSTSFSYMVFDANSGQALGKNLDSDLQLLSAFDNKLYLVAPGGKSTTLSVFKVK